LEAVLAEMDRRADNPAPVPAPERTWVDDLFAGPRPVDEDDDPIEQGEEWARFDALLADGVDERQAYAEAFGKDVDKVRREEAIVRLRDEGFTGRSFEELARGAYRVRLEEDYFAAEAATNGYLLNSQGVARGIDPRELWRQNETYARKWASDELLEWWDERGRITFAQFQEELLTGSNAARFRTGGETWQQ
ncbi:MAG TPA: hypothetical protein VM677_27120, partial [Actinokineospora sp.]|nr:hypothetical protein [Actinokineospora sp.]